MLLPHRNALPSWAPRLIDNTEMALIAAMAILLPFDHWFFGHMVNPAPMRVLGFVLTGVWLLQITSRKIQFKFEYWHAFTLIFLVICFCSAIFSPAIPDPTIPNYRYKILATIKIAAALLFLAMACHALNREKIILFLRIHLVLGVSICTVSLIMYALHMTRVWPNGFALWVEPDIYTFVRIQGVSYEPHRFGAYAMTLIPWLLIPDLHKSCGWGGGVALVALAIVFFSLLLSFAVGTFIALPVLLLLLACYSPQNLSIMLRIALGATLLLALATKFPSVYESVLEVIYVKMHSQSLTDRQYQWAFAVLEVIINPWTGVGPEAYSYFVAYLDPRMPNATPVSNPPQSMLLGIMANTGFPGIVSFILFLTAFLINYVMRYRKTGGDRLISYASFAIALSHFVYQQSIWLPWALNQWLFMAMAWAALWRQPEAPKNVARVQS
jgi:O-antigen ligase